MHDKRPVCLHVIGSLLLERMCWRQFAVRRLKKNQIVPFSFIMIIIITTTTATIIIIIIITIVVVITNIVIFYY